MNTEGWQGEAHSNQRVFHYIRESFSLCRKLGFYTGSLMPHDPNRPKGRDDCAACFKRLEKENKKK